MMHRSAVLVSMSINLLVAIAPSSAAGAAPVGRKEAESHLQQKVDSGAKLTEGQDKKVVTKPRQPLATNRTETVKKSDSFTLVPSKVEGSLAKAVSKSEKTTAKVEPEKTEKAGAKADSHRPKAESADKTSQKFAQKTDGKTDQSAKKSETTDKKLSKKVTARSDERYEDHPRVGLVPPPPPDTPSMMTAPYGTGSYYSPQYAPFEMMSPETLKTRQKELAEQLENAKSAVKTKQTNFDDRGVRAQQFVDLYNEGVISRRELEASQEEIKQSKSDLDSANAKVQDIQFALQRINEKITHVFKYPAKANKTSATRDGKKAKGHQSVASKTDTLSKSAIKPGGPVPVSAVAKDASANINAKSGPVPTDDNAKASASVSQPSAQTVSGTSPGAANSAIKEAGQSAPSTSLSGTSMPKGSSGAAPASFNASADSAKP